MKAKTTKKYFCRSLNPPTDQTQFPSFGLEKEEGAKEKEREDANLTPSFNLPHLPEPSQDEIEPKFVLSNHEFARTLLWNFEDIRMLIGSVKILGNFSTNQEQIDAIKIYNLTEKIL